MTLSLRMVTVVILLLVALPTPRVHATAGPAVYAALQAVSYYSPPIYLSKMEVPQCPKPSLSITPPDSVHYLRFSDIRLVGAMGDSISAAFSSRMMTYPVVYDYRETSYSGGIADDIFTMPKMLKQFAPELLGPAESAELPYLNCAVTSAFSYDLVGQAETLISRVLADERMDMENDWKMVTMCIGHNDICVFCKDLTADESAGWLRYHLQQALDKLQQELPRTIVNLLPTINIDFHQDVSRPWGCYLLLRATCSCLSSRLSRVQFLDWIRKHQQAAIDLVESGRYDNDDNFTVVIQPSTLDFDLPRQPNGQVQNEFLAGDCFHPSIWGQELAGKLLWNSIVTPVGSKPKGPGSTVEVLCPDVDVPYIPTRMNAHLWSH